MPALEVAAQQVTWNWHVWPIPTADAVHGATIDFETMAAAVSSISIRTDRLMTDNYGLLMTHGAPDGLVLEDQLYTMLNQPERMLVSIVCSGARTMRDCPLGPALPPGRTAGQEWRLELNSGSGSRTHRTLSVYHSAAELVEGLHAQPFTTAADVGLQVSEHSKEVLLSRM